MLEERTQARSFLLPLGLAAPQRPEQCEGASWGSLHPRAVPGAPSPALPPART